MWNIEENYYKNTFECSKTGSFISRILVCDNNSDCSASEDETNCLIKFEEIFICRKSQETLNIKLVCNFIKDCQDGSDEEFCSMLNVLHSVFIRTF